MQIGYDEYVRVMAGESTKRQIVVRRFREVNEALAESRRQHEVYRARMNAVLDLCFKAAVGRPLESEDPTLVGCHEVFAIRELRNRAEALQRQVEELTAKLAKKRTK